MPENSSRHRIAFFLSSFRPGGGEKQIIDIANATAARGHTVDLLVLKPVGDLQSRIAPGVTVVSLDRRRMVLSLFPLMRYMRTSAPAVILAVDEHVQLLSLAARLVGRFKVKIILRLGNMLSVLFARYEGKSKLMPFLIRHLYKKADAVIANSRGVARDVSRVCGIPEERIHVIFNPKDLAALAASAAEPVDEPWLMQKTEPVVAWFGRLREQKNIPLLLRAFATLQKEVPSRLVLAGQGREQGRLESLVRELGIAERVRFVGYQDNPLKFVAKADVYVLSSLWEGLPNALIEALACGVACVAADCDSGPREILAPDTDPFKRIKEGIEWARFGALIPVNGERELAQALTILLTDADKRQSYARAASERSRAFDEQDIIPRYLSVLDVLNP